MFQSKKETTQKIETAFHYIMAAFPFYSAGGFAARVHACVPTAVPRRTRETAAGHPPQAQQDQTS